MDAAEFPERRPQIVRNPHESAAAIVYFIPDGEHGFAILSFSTAFDALDEYREPFESAARRTAATPSSWQFDAAVTGLVADDVDTFVAAADGEVASFFGSSLPVTGTGAGALALDAKAVYVAAVVEDKYAIVAIDRATLSTKTLVADAGEPAAIATDATRVYWVDVGTTPAEFRPTVRVIEKAGGEPRQLTTTASPQAPGTLRLTATEDALTFADALGDLYRVDKDSGETFPLTATIVSAAAGWGPAVVFTDVSGQTLSSVDARAGHAPDEQTVDTIDAQYRISALAFTPEGDRLFATCNLPGGLVRAYEATR